MSRATRWPRATGCATPRTTHTALKSVPLLEHYAFRTQHRLHQFTNYNKNVKKKSLRAESGQRGNGKEFVDGKQGICTVTYRTVCRETSLLEGRTHCDEFNAHRHPDAKLCFEHATTKALAGPIILLHNDALQVQVLLVIQPFAAAPVCSHNQHIYTISPLKLNLLFLLFQLVFTLPPSTSASIPRRSCSFVRFAVLLIVLL